MKKLALICLSITAMVLMASCRGPRGPQGPVGPAGQDGNANVISATVTVRASQWHWEHFYTDVEGNERGQYSVIIDFNAITDDIFDYGAVLVYMDNDGVWQQLPMTYYYEDGDYLAEASIEVTTRDDGAVGLFWTQSDFWQVRPDTHRFKIVAIEATYYDHRSDVDYSNYNAVKAAFQLAD